MRRSTGDVDLLKLAVLHDPLVGAICSPEEVWQMVDEMLVAQAEWLPQYADAIPAAKERLAQANVATRDWEGAARREACARSRTCAREQPSEGDRSAAKARPEEQPATRGRRGGRIAGRTAVTSERRKPLTSNRARARRIMGGEDR